MMNTLPATRLPHLARNPHRRPLPQRINLDIDPWKTRLKPMTIVLCMASLDSIMMAADSEGTLGSAKTFNERKITVLKAKNASILVGIAGSSERAERAIEYMRDALSGFDLTKSGEMAQIANDAVASAVAEMFPDWQDRTMVTAKIESDGTHQFQLTIGFFCAGVPHVYQIDNVSASPTPIDLQKRDWACAGIGTLLATYLLGNVLRRGQNDFTRMCAMLHTVSEVKRNVVGCGGETAFFTLKSDGTAAPLQPKLIEDFESDIKKHEDEKRAQFDVAMMDTYGALLRRLWENPDRYK
jgi:hypothetical protein